MTYITVMDLILSLAILIALIYLLTGWKRAFRYDTKSILAGLLVVTLAHGLIRFLEWSEIGPGTLDPFSDFLATMEPMLWIFFFYSFLKAVSRKRIKNLNSLLRAIRNVNQSIVQGESLKAIAQEACEQLLEARSYLELSIAFLNDDTGKISPFAGAGENICGKGWSITPDGSGEAPKCIKKAVESEEVEILDPEDCKDCNRKGKLPVDSIMLVPIKVHGQFVGLLYAALGKDQGGEFGEEEQSLLKEVAGDLGFAREKVQAEKDLKESEERLELALEGTQAGWWDWNVQTGEVFINETWAETLGYQAEDLQPLHIDTWKELTHPEDLEKRTEALREHFAGNTDLYEVEVRMKSKNGDWIWVLDRGRLVERDDQCRPLRMVGTQMEITERKEAQENFRQSFVQLAETTSPGRWPR